MEIIEILKVYKTLRYHGLDLPLKVGSKNIVIKETQTTQKHNALFENTSL